MKLHKKIIISLNILTSPDSSIRLRRYINHVLTYLLTYLQFDLSHRSPFRPSKSSENKDCSRLHYTEMQ